MPEGDTVFRAARIMRRALAGKVLTATDFRVPEHATADLSGQTVVTVMPRGKHMLTRTDAGITLHTHLMMDGVWRIYRPGRRWAGPAHQIRVVLSTLSCSAVGYRLPVVELLPTADEDKVVGHLGPDLLGPDWDLEEALRRLTERPARTVAEAIMDQRNLAGIGNLYKNEALYLKGVHPWTPAGEVTDLKGVVKAARKAMKLNLGHPEQATTGNLAPGHRHWVYGRGGQPCRRCGTTIRTGELGEPGMERVTYWCPHCQPEAEQRPPGSGRGPG